eukprot:TRINITY_DN10942_c0_g1_i1.p1 TRINITY_DN10942_c0_g1~~TRINITY_DN10942_c0_g1_i1.p1  ORF type:complete len:172 (-),score=32.16 TRINITY_DN10942_c0_g1_i1:36-530(-)
MKISLLGGPCLIPSLLLVLSSLTTLSSSLHQDRRNFLPESEEVSNLFKSLFLQPFKKSSSSDHDPTGEVLKNEQKPHRNSALGFLVRPMKRDEAQTLRDFMMRPTKRGRLFEIRKKDAKDFLMRPLRSEMKPLKEDWRSLNDDHDGRRAWREDIERELLFPSRV